MKSFKLVAFQMENRKGEVIEIPLLDGLIINNENERKTWLIELFIKDRFLQEFEDFTEEDDIPVQVIITQRENDPAFFQVNLVSKKRIKSFASVLLEGKLSQPHFVYAEKLLERLIQSGLSGDELLKKFQEKMRDKKHKLQSKRN